MKKTYLVLLVNHTDQRDNESASVSADTPEEAREKASKRITRSRFSIGKIIEAKGDRYTSRQERSEISSLKSICVHYWD